MPQRDCIETADGNRRLPLASVVLLVFNQEEYVEEALKSVLSQDYRPIEIVVSDDCSSDASWSVIQETIRSSCPPGHVIVRRNSRNLGLAENLNAAVRECSGEFIFLAAGDDVSKPNRVSACMSVWIEAEETVHGVCCRFEEIDRHSRITGVQGGQFFVPDLSKPVADWRCGATGACAAYSRRVFDDFGSLDTAVQSEDWVLSFRSWLLGGGVFLEEPLVLHRTHEDSISQRGRSIRRIATNAHRRSVRKRMMAGASGIAREWLKAWKVAEAPRDRVPELERRVRVCELLERGVAGSRGDAVRSILGLMRVPDWRGVATVFVRGLLGLH